MAKPGLCFLSDTAFLTLLASYPARVAIFIPCADELIPLISKIAL